MMQDMTEVTQGPFIVAVSGGVDSVVLLDMLVADKLPLIVAHVHHGIRSDSDEDEQHVRELAKQYGVPFESIRLSLGPNASEETARSARYTWLDSLRKSSGARAVATAHHQDDVIETVLINLVRGTGWRGLCSLRNGEERYRPLLAMSKAEIIAYAIDHNLTWREDSTNESLRYLRNRIRHQVVPRLTASQRQQLLDLNTAQCEIREHIETETRRLVAHYNDAAGLRRYPLIMSEGREAYELLRAWLGESLERERLRDLLLFVKTARSGDKWSLDSERFVAATATRLIVLPPRD